MLFKIHYTIEMIRPFVRALSFNLIVFASAANAQIVWGPVTHILNDSDVNANGSYVDAFQGLPSGQYGYLKPPETVNGNLFNSDDGSLTDGIISFGGPLGGGSDGSQGQNLSAAYNSVLSGCLYVDDIPGDYQGGVLPSPAPTGTISLAVTPGTTYQVQLWDAYANNYRDTIFSVGDSAVELTGQQYVIGTFTATSSTEVIDFNGTTAGGSSGIGEVNAVDLRAVPEPSTWVMLAGGLVLAGFGLRRKLSRI